MRPIADTWPRPTPPWQPGPSTPFPGQQPGPGQQPAPGHPGPLRPATVHPFPPADPQPWWEERLFDRRIVQVTGHLDAERASVLAAKLLTLDADGRQPVTLRIDSPNADLTAAWTLIDTLDALIVDVNALVTGEIGGGSLALLTAATNRRSQPHARFRLGDPVLPPWRGRWERSEQRPQQARDEPSVLFGTAGEVSGELAGHRRLLDAFHRRLAETTGRELDEVVADCERGRFLSAPDALEYGLVTDLGGHPAE